MPAEDKVKSTQKPTGWKRTRTGCALCRSRKSKCDEIRPRCTRCIKANSECLWPLDVPKSDLFRPAIEAVELPDVSSPGSARGSSSSTHNAVASSSRLAPVRRQPSESALEVQLYSSPTSMLEMSYPIDHERMLMSHFLHVIQLGVAPPTDSAVPAPSYGRPQAIDHVIPTVSMDSFLSTTIRSTAHEAMSLSFLASGACALSNAHRRSAVASPSNADQADHYTELSASLLASSLALIETSRIMLAIHQKRPRLSVAPLDGTSLTVARSEPGGVEGPVADQLALLASAAIGVLWVRYCAGGSSYSDVLDAVKPLVDMQGGPVAMLERAKLKGPTALRKVRSSLEEITMWHEFSSLATGIEPSLSLPPPLFDSSRPCPPQIDDLQSWYFSYCPPSGALRSRSSQDWETTEAALGVSRGFVELLHRVNVLFARSRPPGWSALAPTASYPLHLDPGSTAQAQLLLAECASWTDFYYRPKPGFLRTRLQAGNQVLALGIEIVLLLDLFFYPPAHPQVQQRQRLICQLVQDNLRLSGFIQGIRWPIVIAASCAIWPGDRDEARTTFEVVRKTSFSDLSAVWAAIQEVWRRRDAGDMWCSWRSVMSENGGLVLF